MSTVVLLVVTGLGLGALYFLIASGLSLIFGLMDVLNFAHGAFLTIGAYATWWASVYLPGAGGDGVGFLVAVAFGVAAGTLAATLVELRVIRPLYGRHRQISSLSDSAWRSPLSCKRSGARTRCRSPARSSSPAR